MTSFLKYDNSNNIIIPKYIFVVPYRNRESYLNMYLNQMPWVLSDMDENEYEIYVCHQKDNRPFNRGGMKNLGFLYAKHKYPYHYKNINIVFQDVDTLPGFKNQFDFETTRGNIKHYYGFTFTLGGILSIKAGDFEQLNGFPNYWAWGFEDNILQNRVLKANMKIDRSKFVNYGDMNVLQFFAGNMRVLDKEGVRKLRGDSGINGVSAIQIKDILSMNVTKLKDNIYMIDFIGWTVPELPEDISFEAKNLTSPAIKQKVIDMGTILRQSKKQSQARVGGRRR